jgi:hypothetical protein
MGKARKNMGFDDTRRRHAPGPAPLKCAAPPPRTEEQVTCTSRAVLPYRSHRIAEHPHPLDHVEVCPLDLLAKHGALVSVDDAEE